jgi:hypothetical protein
MHSEPTTVAHRRQLAALGVDKDRIRRAVQAGRWQEHVPGVVVLHSGALTRRERHLAALAWAGPQGRLSHTSALVLHGARVDEPAARARVAGVRGHFPRRGTPHRAQRWGCVAAVVA